MLTPRFLSFMQARLESETCRIGQTDHLESPHVDPARRRRFSFFTRAALFFTRHEAPERNARIYASGLRARN